jgi:hypothetical protein
MALKKRIEFRRRPRRLRTERTVHLRTYGLLKSEAKATLRLLPGAFLALLLVAVLWRVDLAAIEGLFQSPPPGGGSSDSPLSTPTLIPTAAPPTRVPTQAPVPTSTPVPTQELPTAILPTETPTPSATATEVLPSDTPVTPTDTPLTPTRTSPTATPVSPTPTLAASGEGGSRYPDDNSNLRFEWGMLFDSVALGLSYLWLCCGLLVLLAIPTFFLILWLAGKRRRQDEE